MVPTAKVEIITLNVLNIITGSFSFLKSSILTRIAPAKSIKLNIAPKNKSKKSKLLIIAVASSRIAGYKFPVINNAKDVTKAISIKPVDGGNFKYLKLM
jgi:hypothetical protein